MTLFPTEMESERLQFESLHPETLDPFELYRHANEDAPHIDEITQYVTWDPYEQPKAAADFIEQVGQEFEDNEGVTYVIRPKEGERAGEFAGLTSIGVEWDHKRAGLGTWLRKPFWGQGYSGERAGRLLELAFDRLELEVVAVEHDPENKKSEAAIQRYVERFGGRKEGVLRNRVIMNGEPRDSVRYSITREEWEANRDA